MAKAIQLLLSVLAASYACDAYKILVVSPLPSKSHSLLGNGIVSHLLNAGHEVTYITPFIKKDVHSKLHQVSTSSHKEDINDIMNLVTLKTIIDKGESYNNPESMLFLMHKFATLTLENENVQILLQDKSQHFDLIIAEWMFSELYSGFQAVFNAPLIWFSTTEPESMLLSTIDEYLNPAYNGYFVADTPPFTFWQRLCELWYTIKVLILRETLLNYMQHQTYKQLIVPHIESRERVPPPFEELKYNASMVLGNSHVTMGEPMRLPPNYKYIGGFHIEEKVEPLPEVLQKSMNESIDGVIYFSIGSNLHSKDLPDELKKNLLKMFGSLKQTVLWKFEENLPDLPKNVHILKWAPQQSILAHPKCVLFITHGGLLSTTEAINVGKPIIGIPAIADQFTNVNRAVNKGFAVEVDLSCTMTDDLKAAIEEVLTNSRYTEKAKEISFIYHDRLTKPGDELVHWAEHVIKTQGALHLRSPALLVPWYQKYYFDLLLFMIVTAIIRYKIFMFIKPYIMPCLCIAKNYVYSIFKRGDVEKINKID